MGVFGALRIQDDDDDGGENLSVGCIDDERGTLLVETPAFGRVNKTFDFDNQKRVFTQNTVKSPRTYFRQPLTQQFPQRPKPVSSKLCAPHIKFKSPSHKQPVIITPPQSEKQLKTKSKQGNSTKVNQTAIKPYQRATIKTNNHSRLMRSLDSSNLARMESPNLSSKRRQLLTPSKQSFTTHLY
ncbi:hypothetical protein FGO68_gene3419 [Halteria grandinella]|uniref:Uncharacterized protein n=1 Tax=Halteria grandinella TaxID=5974 RepID=A0A8J8NCP2_HALGN|nr:hypothetical protein FGO68_gene3419 [Halteria grandinella]